MKTAIAGLWRDEEAITTVEYALLLSTIVLASMTAWAHLGEGIRETVNDAADHIGIPDASG
ncbi:MAG: Flp family type IVb pilin [Armatimonadia bacterium]|nr:Flp family type IVb pilin [Armatimonadia bacterium]